MAEAVQQGERAGDVPRSPPRVRPRRRISTTLNRGKTSDRLIDASINLTSEQVLLNLLRNAKDAMEGADTKRRSIVITAPRSGKHAVGISVTDLGPGIPTEVVDTIFEPFVTTKPLGMGMGLSISRSIVQLHGGSLQMAPNSLSGAIFFFDPPTAEEEASADAG